jgi:hypothetical protein
MAYFVRRSPDRVELRESVATAQGPRSRTLASFRGPLTADVLARAASRATRPFDAAALRRKAQERGIEVSEVAHESEARALLRRLRRSDRMDPVLVGLLRQALDRQPVAEVQEHLAEAAEWIGASPAERGHALRGLLRLYDRIRRNRPPQAEPPRAPLPRVSSAAAGGEG